MITTCEAPVTSCDGPTLWLCSWARFVAFLATFSFSYGGLARLAAADPIGRLESVSPSNGSVLWACTGYQLVCNYSFVGDNTEIVDMYAIVTINGAQLPQSSVFVSPGAKVTGALSWTISTCVRAIDVDIKLVGVGRVSKKVYQLDHGLNHYTLVHRHILFRSRCTYNQPRINYFPMGVSGRPGG